MTAGGTPAAPTFLECHPGYVDTPSLFIAGAADSGACAGTMEPIPEAELLNLTNCEWMYEGLGNAIAAQSNSPHQLTVFPNTGHVPTNKEGPANDVVDVFLAGVLATNPPYPFAPQPVPIFSVLVRLLLAGGMGLIGSLGLTKHRGRQ